MKAKAVLFLLLVVQIKSYSQKIVGINPSVSASEYNLVNNTFQSLNTYAFNNLVQGFSTADRVNGRYIFTSSGSASSSVDTLILIDIVSGNTVKKTYPKSTLLNPEYDEVHNKVVGVDPNGGIAELNLTSNTFQHLNTYHFSGMAQGFSTFDHINGRYIFACMGSSPLDIDTLFFVDVVSGSIVMKKTYPRGDLTNPEYDQVHNKIVGINPDEGLAVLDLASNVFQTIKLYNFNGIPLGFSTFDQINGRYIFEDMGSTLDTLIFIDVVSGTIVMKKTYPKSGIWNPEFFPGPCLHLLNAHSNGPLCSGQLLQLGMDPTVTYNDAAYDWTGPGGFSSHLVNPALADVHANKMGMYTLIRNDKQGCIDTASIFVQVNPVPLSGFTQNTLSACFSGNDFIFRDTSSVSSGSTTRTWDLGDGNFASDSIFHKNYVKPGTYRLKLVERAANCTDTTAKTIVVYPSTHIGFTINQHVQCLQNQFVFSDTSSIQSGTFTRLWQLGDGTHSDSSIKHHSYSPGSYSIKLFTTTDHLCHDSMEQQITVLPFPKPTAGYTQEHSGQCLRGNRFTLNDTSSVTSGSIYRQWYFGDSAASSDSSIHTSFSKAGIFSVKLFITSDHGCKDSVIKLLTVYPQPTAGLTINHPVQCLDGNQFIFSDTSFIQSFPYSRTWDLGDMTADTTINVSKSYTDTGQYRVLLKVNDANNCKDSMVQSITIKQNPAKPLVTAVISTIIRSTPSENYTWYINDIPILNSDTQIIYIHQNGLYKVRTDSSNGCSNMSDPIYENPEIDGIRIYPNPNPGQFMIDFYTAEGEKQIELFDMDGRLVATYVTTDHAIEIHMEAVASGVYMVRVTTGSKSLHAKVVIYR